MARKRADPNKRNPVKIAFLLAFVVLLTTTSSLSMTFNPQHLWISNETQIQNTAFSDNNTVTVRGHQAQYGEGSLIPVEGRDYIRITGEQTHFGNGTYQEGIRTLNPSLEQNPLAEQELGTYPIGTIMQVSVDNVVINIIPTTKEILYISTAYRDTGQKLNSYHVQFAQDTIPLMEAGAFIKLRRTATTITASVIGVSGHYLLAVEEKGMIEVS